RQSCLLRRRIHLSRDFFPRGETARNERRSSERRGGRSHSVRRRLHRFLCVELDSRRRIDLYDSRCLAVFPAVHTRRRRTAHHFCISRFRFSPLVAAFAKTSALALAGILHPDSAREEPQNNLVKEIFMLKSYKGLLAMTRIAPSSVQMTLGTR